MKDLLLKKFKRFFDLLPFLIAAIYIAFSPLITNDNVYIMIMFLSFFIWILIHIKDMCINFKNYHVTWLLFIAWMIISIIYSTDKINGIKFSAVFSSIVMIGIFISFDCDYYIKFFINFLWGLLWIHIFATFISFFKIDLIIQFCSNFMNHNTCLQIERWAVEFNSYAGIAGQLGTNALMISLYLSITLAKLIEKKKISYIAFFILGWIALVLTGKETFYLANFLGLLTISIIIIQKKYPNILKKFMIALGIILVICFFLIILNYDKLLDIYYERSIDSRLILYQSAFNAFESSPIIGHGINTIMLFSEHLTHNIYLQLAAEIGLMGLIIFISSIAITIIATIKKMLHNQTISNFLIISIYLQIFLLVDGFFGNPLFDYKFIIPYYFLIFIALKSGHLKNKNLKGNNS